MNQVQQIKKVYLGKTGEKGESILLLLLLLPAGAAHAEGAAAAVSALLYGAASFNPIHLSSLPPPSLLLSSVAPQSGSLLLLHAFPLASSASIFSSPGLVGCKPDSPILAAVYGVAAAFSPSAASAASASASAAGKPLPCNKSFTSQISKNPTQDLRPGKIP